VHAQAARDVYARHDEGLGGGDVHGGERG
jgi:hypothetical protein